MATFCIPNCLTILTLLVFHFKLMVAAQSSSFYLPKFDKDPNFESQIALFGDAEAVGNGFSLQLTKSVSTSSGSVMYKKPIKLVEGNNPTSFVSFSSYVSFSLSNGSGDGLALFMIPSGFNVNGVDSNAQFGISLGSKKKSDGVKIVVVEFDTLKDEKYGDLNDNHVGLDVGGFVSVKVKNVSAMNLALNSGKRLHSWIDYEAGSRRLEVRLSESGDEKPVDPLLSHPIDLSKMWNDEKVMVGLSSSNRNSSQTCFIYLWSFKSRTVPQWMHSEPVDPNTIAKNTQSLVVPKKSNCLLKVLAAMIFGTACGALGAFMVLYLWTIFGNRRPVAPKDYAVHPVDFEYEKVKVVIDEVVKDDKK